MALFLLLLFWRGQELESVLVKIQNSRDPFNGCLNKTLIVHDI